MKQYDKIEKEEVEKKPFRVEVVNCDKLNIRALRTKKSQVVTIVNAGHILETTENVKRPKNGYVEVTSDAFKGTGFAAAEYLNVIDK